MPDPLAPLTELEGVASAYAAARDGIDARLRDRGLRRTTPEQTAESLLVGAHASAVLEGSTATLDQLRSGSDDLVAGAALRLNSGLLELVPIVGSSPVQAFARMHLLAGGSSPADQRGRPVGDAEAERLAALARTLRETSAPGLLVAAVAHAELVTLAGFASANGLVGRATERLLLVARGVDPAGVLCPEAGHLQLRAEYESNLRAYASGSRSGVAAWLRYAAEAVTVAAELSMPE